MKTTSFLIAMSYLVDIASCSSGQSEPANPETSAKPRTTTGIDPPRSPLTPEPSATALAVAQPPAAGSGNATTGIPDCDRLLKHYDDVIDSVKRCVESTPAHKMALGSVLSALEDSKKAVMAATKSQEDDTIKTRLADSCKSSMPALRPIPCPDE